MNTKATELINAVGAMVIEEKQFLTDLDAAIGDGDHGINIDGNKVKLIKHEHIEEEITHATLFTKKYNNYFANGMLSGNRHSKEINL